MSKSIRFCQECNNLLYPKEDKEHRQLMYACRQCTYSEPAESLCVYSHRVNNQMNELNMIITDVVTDPTLPRAYVCYPGDVMLDSKNQLACPECGTEGPVYFQAQFNRADSGMRLYYVCVNQQCGHKWIDSTLAS